MLLLNFSAPKDKQPLISYKRLVITPFDGEVKWRTNPLLNVENVRGPTNSGFTSYWVKKVAFQSTNHGLLPCNTRVKSDLLLGNKLLPTFQFGMKF